MDLDAYLSRPDSESMAKFARRCDFNADQIRQWRYEQDGRRPSPASCVVIERASEGLVTCDDLRPDLVWHRIKDRKWPWHPEGRPLIDVTKTAEAA